MSPKISVIIPVFNAEIYISSCISSLLSQTLTDIELVFVDDHGSDSSMALVRKAAGQYDGPIRILLTETECNSGPGAARNVGIATSSGEFIAFVDSDDCVDPCFCEELYNAAISAGADLACCDIRIGDRIRANADVSDKKRFLRHFVSFFTTFIYRKSMLIEWNICFPPTQSAEDTCFLACSIICSVKMAQVHRPLYSYSVNEASVSKRKNHLRGLQRLRSFSYLMTFAKEKGLLSQYRFELSLIYLKKGLGMAIIDFIFG